MLGDPSALEAHERRLDAAAAARSDARRHVEAIQHPGLRALVADLLFDSSASQAAEALPGARPDKLLKFPWRRARGESESESESESSDSNDDGDDDGESAADDEHRCGGCGERGHAQTECPHRSDVSEDEAISSDGED